MRVIQRSIAVGLFVSKDGRFLLGKKDPESGGVYPNCWHIPGGGVNDDAGETVLQALAREMHEEVGLDVSQGTVELVDDTGTGGSQKTLTDGEVVWCEMKFSVYRIDLPIEAVDTTVISGDDIVEAKWVDPNDLQDIKLTPPSIELFAKLGYL